MSRSNDEDQMIVDISLCDRFEKTIDAIDSPKKIKELSQHRSLAARRYNASETSLFATLFAWFAFGFFAGADLIDDLNNTKKE